MKIAVVGSRRIYPDEKLLQEYLLQATEIVSGGAEGVDSCAADYAKSHGIAITEFLPKYERYGRAAPILRNKEIVNYADKIIAFWDGKSKGTFSVINYAKQIQKECEIIIIDT